MKTYESMKSSSVFWLGMIPEHWEERFLEQTCHEKCIKNIGNTESNVLSLSYGYIIKKKNVYSGLVAKDFSTYQIVQSGDIILRFTDLQNDHRSLRTGLVTQTGIITSAYTCITPTINSAYLHYLLHAYDLQKVFYGMGGGVRQSIGYKDVRHMTVLVPPREEQDQIVRFLDWKVSEINRLINIKHQSIKTLKELMYAEIEKQLAVYPVAENVRLKQIGSFFKGGGFSRDNLVDDTRCPAILYGDIYTQYEYKTSRITHYVDVDAYAMSKKIAKGDIVMAGTGETKDEIGKPILYTGDEKVAVGGDVIVFSPNDNVNAEYILYQLYSQASLKHRYINGKGDIIVHIYPTALGNTTISLPSIEDQKKAVIAINNIIDSVHETMDKLEREVAVLKEFSVRMISDVVTGKIDVRGIEIPEYEYTVEEDNIDHEIEETENQESDVNE